MIYLIFSIFSYLIGMSSLVYLFWFIEFGDAGPAPAFFASSLLINVSAFLIFPLQHSLLARQFVKKRMNPYAHRSFYVLTSGLALWAVLIVWRPFGPFLYRDFAPWFMNVLFYASLLLILASTIALNHSQMFGLSQGYAGWKGRVVPESGLETRGIYGIVRHPLTSLLIIALWSHESLSAGRLLFNALFTAYALVGTVFEERSLVKAMGKDYVEYRKKVPAFIPRF